MNEPRVTDPNILRMLAEIGWQFNDDFVPERAHDGCRLNRLDHQNGWHTFYHSIFADEWPYDEPHPFTGWGKRMAVAIHADEEPPTWVAHAVPAYVGLVDESLIDLLSRYPFEGEFADDEIDRVAEYTEVIAWHPRSRVRHDVVPDELAAAIRGALG